MKKSHLLRGVSCMSTLVACSIFAAPAFAQDSTLPQAETPQGTTTSSPVVPATPQEERANDDIVITGSIIRNAVTPSPVTTLTTDNLDKRGISTVQDAIQQLSSNNGPALTNSFTANGAFAAGASSVSLRGLSTNSTLVLFDGLRAAYYPLADDGSRNFVDLNTIPDDIVERIDVLRDGASSSYGADAISGVVNIVTKKEVKGLLGRAEAGIAERGFGGTQRLSLTAGHGDLSEDGYNAYISGFYYHADMVKNNKLRYPYSSDNQTGIGGPNGDVGGTANTTPTSSTFLVRPYDPTNTTLIGGARYANLDLNNCTGNVVTATAAELAASATAPLQRCEIDYTNKYGVVAPEITRFGVSSRVTANLGSSEAYLEANFQQSRTFYTGFPAALRGLAPTGINYPQFATDRNGGTGTIYAAGSGILALPVYVCPLNGQAAVLVNGVAQAPGGCNATTPGATLNPNNPYAAQGNVARILGRDVQNVTSNETRSRVYRAAAGIHGTFADGWDFGVDATAMHTDLRLTASGYTYIQRLLDVVADGRFNFRDPTQNSQAVMDYLRPTNRRDASSDLAQLQASVQHAFVQLPGGPLTVALGGSIYYEAVDAPSGNPDYNGPTQRYFTLNAFGTSGNRTVTSAFGEINAPILDQLGFNLSGRYDHYSSGQHAFSPKAGVKFTPFRQLTLRGTYSRGFRIPSFGEANALPTTGYVNNTAGVFNNAYLAQYGCTVATFSQCPTYVRSGSYGLTTLASPNLEPEKSRSFTAGILIEPIRNVRFTADYFNIRKTNVITSPDTGTAVQNYYLTGATQTGNITVIPGAVDPAFPNARPTIAFVQSQLINASQQKSEGIDFGANISHDFGGLRWTSNLDATWLIELSTTQDGVRQTYVDTLGNYNLTAGTGTFEWRGNWQNTFEVENVALTGTVNYTSGYNLSAMDQGCAYRDSCLAVDYLGTRVKSYITADFNASIKVNDAFTFYVNMINAFNRLPGIDPATYGANLYNPVQAGLNVYGRQFRAGAKFNF